MGTRVWVVGTCLFTHLPHKLHFCSIVWAIFWLVRQPNDRLLRNLFTKLQYSPKIHCSSRILLIKKAWQRPYTMNCYTMEQNKIWRVVSITHTKHTSESDAYISLCGNTPTYKVYKINTVIPNVCWLWIWPNPSTTSHCFCYSIS